MASPLKGWIVTEYLRPRGPDGPSETPDVLDAIARIDEALSSLPDDRLRSSLHHLALWGEYIQSPDDETKWLGQLSVGTWSQEKATPTAVFEGLCGQSSSEWPVLVTYSSPRLVVLPSGTLSSNVLYYHGLAYMSDSDTAQSSRQSRGVSGAFVENRVYLLARIPLRKYWNTELHTLLQPTSDNSVKETTCDLRKLLSYLTSSTLPVWQRWAQDQDAEVQVEDAPMEDNEEVPEEDESEILEEERRVAKTALAVKIANHEYLQDHGAELHEHVDGYKAIQSLTKLRDPLSANLCTLVAWGSPHMELSDGSWSRDKSGSAAIEKAKVFESLCAQFPRSAVLVTYCVTRGIEPTIDLDTQSLYYHGWAFIDTTKHEQPKVECAPESLGLAPALFGSVSTSTTAPTNSHTTPPYSPKFSKGGVRCTHKEVYVLVRVPLEQWPGLDWKTLFQTDTSGDNTKTQLHLWKLISLLSPNTEQGQFMLFLGEETATMSQQAAEWHIAHL